MISKAFFLSLLLTLLVMVACSQSGSSSGASPDLAKANDLFQSAKYAEALPLYKKLAEATDSPALPWMRLAFCQLQTNDARSAIASYETAIKKGGPAGFAHYNMACAYARLGNKSKALEELEKAIEAQFGTVDQYQTDDDFASLRNDPRFKSLMEKLPNPIKAFKGADAMDLWVGEWEVFTANGQRAGQNSITKVLGGFGIEERWTNVGGNKGQSLFTFEPSKGTWRQLWIDDKGWTVDGIGVVIDNGIRFEGDSIFANGQKGRIRTTLSKNPDGSVRQLIETEGPPGTWTVGFDAKYVRKNAK